MCCSASIVWRMGFARISAIFARSSRVLTSIVVWVVGGFWVVSAIRSLWGAISFSIGFLGVFGFVLLWKYVEKASPDRARAVRLYAM